MAASIDFKYDVFVSYTSKRHKEKVYALCKEFKKSNILYWIDTEQMKKGSPAALMMAGINDSNYFICCLSDLYSDSKPCLNELRYASDLDKTIFFVIFEDIAKGENCVKRFGEAGFYMAGQLFYKYNKETDMEKLISTLKNESESDLKKLFSLPKKESKSNLKKPIPILENKFNKLKLDDQNLEKDLEELWGKGNKFFDQGLINEAIKCYEECIRMKPDYYKAHYNKGVALYNLNQKEAAIRCYDEAIRLKPDDDDADLLKLTDLFKLNEIDFSIENNFSLFQFKLD